MNTAGRAAAALAFAAAMVGSVTAQAGAAPVGAQSLASCSPHHLNTAYWATCSSGSTPSKVRVAGLCKQLIGGPVWRWSDWKSVPGGNSTPVRGECVRAVLDSKVQVNQL